MKYVYDPIRLTFGDPYKNECERHGLISTRDSRDQKCGFCGDYAYHHEPVFIGHRRPKTVKKALLVAA